MRKTHTIELVTLRGGEQTFKCRIGDSLEISSDNGLFAIVKVQADRLIRIEIITDDDRIPDTLPAEAVYA